MQQPLHPLSDRELDELSDYLATAPDAMPFIEAHGFLTAIGSAPTTLMPTDWAPEVLGEDGISTEPARHAFGLIIRLYNEIINDLNEGNEVASFFEADEDYILWCAGYLAGARMDNVWLRDENGAVFLFPMAILSGEFDLVGEEDENGNIIKDAKPHLQRAREGLEDLVHEAYAYWAEWRIRNAAADSRPKVGRNEPCPCGSGRKFKKCCALKVP